MTLFMIGLGLGNEQDISLRGLETVKKCDFVYLESYTSLLQVDKEKLEALYGKEIITADRSLVETKADEMIVKAKENNVAFLVVGDPFCATTHIDLRMRAKEESVSVEVIHNSSIISAVGVVGLEVYKYGKVTSIPFHNENVNTPFEVYEKNQSVGLHTLFLLDLDPIKQEFLSIADASKYLISKGISSETLAIGCARIGAKDQFILAESLAKLSEKDFGKAPYCLIIPGKMHFMEEEALLLWKD